MSRVVVVAVVVVLVVSIAASLTGGANADMPQIGTATSIVRPLTGPVDANPMRAVRITTVPPPTTAPPRRGGCDGIYDEMRRQGADVSTARQFAYYIAPRESGCSPQFTHDSDDWSYSRFGLNGLTAGLRSYWRSICGADVRWDTRVLSVDVRCALAGYRDRGWRPWAT